jgi:MerR family transcriptional regulator, copper efflux regulator
LESIPAFTIDDVTAMSLEKRFLSSGALAKLAGVSADTLRHYERKGVLARPRRAANGYRQYPAEALQRVRLIRRALAVGFTLDELANILQVRDSGGAPCHEVRVLAATKLSNIETQLRELAVLRDELQVTLKDWDSRLAQRAPGTRASLLESLAADESNEVRPSRSFPLKPKTKKEKKSK